MGLKVRFALEPIRGYTGCPKSHAPSLTRYILRYQGHQIYGVMFGITKMVKGYSTVYPNILPFLLCHIHILRYNAPKRGHDFWDTLYMNDFVYVQHCKSGLVLSYLTHDIHKSSQNIRKMIDIITCGGPKVRFALEIKSGIICPKIMS